MLRSAQAQPTVQAQLRHGQQDHVCHSSMAALVRRCAALNRDPALDHACNQLSSINPCAALPATPLSKYIAWRCNACPLVRRTCQETCVSQAQL